MESSGHPPSPAGPNPERRRPLAVLLALPLCVLVGCGGGDDDNGAGTPDRAPRTATQTETARQDPAPVPVEKDLRCSRGRTVARGRALGASTANVNDVVTGRAGMCLQLRKPSTQGAAVVYRVRCTTTDGSKATQRGSSIGLSVTRIRSASEARDDERCRVIATAYMYEASGGSQVSCDPSGCDISAGARQRASGRLEVAIVKPG